MKKIKILFAAAIFCAAALVGYYAYDQITMTPQERLIIANLEALSQDEGTAVGKCHIQGTGKSNGYYRICNTETSVDRIYPCPVLEIYTHSAAETMCTK